MCFPKSLCVFNIYYYFFLLSKHQREKPAPANSSNSSSKKRTNSDFGFSLIKGTHNGEYNRIMNTSINCCYKAYVYDFVWIKFGCDFFYTTAFSVEIRTCMWIWSGHCNMTHKHKHNQHPNISLLRPNIITDTMDSLFCCSSFGFISSNETNESRVCSM